MNDWYILRMENEFNQKRLEVAKQYLLDNQKNPLIFTDEDLMGIYSCLLAKAEIKKKKDLDKITE